MSILLKNTTVHGILLDALFDARHDHPDKMAVYKLVKEGIASGAVRPLPSTTFTHQQVEQSFRFAIVMSSDYPCFRELLSVFVLFSCRYMATGKHIGKVVLRIREEEKEKIVVPKPQTVSAVPRTYMNPDKSYILIGN